MPPPRTMDHRDPSSALCLEVRDPLPEALWKGPRGLLPVVLDNMPSLICGGHFIKFTLPLGTPGRLGCETSSSLFCSSEGELVPPGRYLCGFRCGFSVFSPASSPLSPSLEGGLSSDSLSEDSDSIGVGSFPSPSSVLSSSLLSSELRSSVSLSAHKQASGAKRRHCSSNEGWSALKSGCG